MRQDTNYAYAVARIKVLENKLLKSSDLDALLSTDPVSLVDSLAAFGYPSSNRVSSEADDIDSQDILASYTEKLSDYFADTVRSVMTFSPEPEVLSCFLIPADYNNLKICVKTIANYREDIDNDLPALSKNGNVDPESLWNAFIKNDFSAIDPVISSAARSALKEFSTSGNSKNSDILIDKACFEAMSNAVSKGCFLTKRSMRKYLSAYADWKNLLAAMRIAKTGGNIELMNKAYLSGNIDKGHFIDIISGKTAPFYGTRYYEFLDSAIASKHDAKHDVSDFSFLEQLSDAYIYGQLIKDRNEPYRINAILAYIAERKRELSAVRLIVVGKRANLSNDEIAKMIDEYNFAIRFIEGV